MTLPPDPLGDIESDLSAVAKAWLESETAERAAERAQRLVDEADARGEVRVRAMSRAFQAVTAAVAWHRPMPRSQLLQLLREVLDETRQLGWWRAVGVAEAAVGLLGNYNEVEPDILDRLQRMSSDEVAATPAIERLWAETALCSGLCAEGRYDEALEHGLVADQLAQSSGVENLDAVTCHVLCYLFLATGDCEGALAVAPRAVAAAGARGRRQGALHYNLLLAQLLAGQVPEAVKHLEDYPWLLGDEMRETQPWLLPLAAAVRARQGRADQARELREADAAARAGEPPWPLEIEANRAWLLADVLLRDQDPQGARAIVDEVLASAGDPEQPLSALNGTQLYAAFSRASEALGDASAALQALKNSQEYCVSWVAESMRSRLLVLRKASGDPDAPRHALRRDRVDAQVAQARAEAAEHALAERTKLVAQVAHEMRNPVSGLLGTTSLLMMSTLDAKQQRFASLAHASAQLLLAICNDVLDLASLEAGRFRLQPQPCDLGAAIAEVADLFWPMANAKKLSLMHQPDAGLPKALVCDALRLKQVLMNLVNNAVKFTAKGQVTIATEWYAETLEHGTLRVAVRDTGPGISHEAQRTLFREFDRGDEATAAGHAGSGLGLALCRQLVELMGGRIGLSSEPGHGCEFTVTLPLSLAAVGGQVLAA